MVIGMLTVANFLTFLEYTMKLKSSENSFFSNEPEPEYDSYAQSSQNEKVQEITPQQKSQSVIGGNIKFRGELIGTEDIHIEGTVEGTIIMEGHNLSIGTQGSIDANVHANNITINGKLNGDVLADELISIKKSAEVRGNLIAPRIQLDDGGKFRGSMDMIDNEQEKKDSHSKFKDKLVHPHLPTKNTEQQSKATPTTSYKSDKKQDNVKSTTNKEDK